MRRVCVGVIAGVVYIGWFFLDWVGHGVVTGDDF